MYGCGIGACPRPPRACVSAPTGSINHVQPARVNIPMVLQTAVDHMFRVLWRCSVSVCVCMRVCVCVCVCLPKVLLPKGNGRDVLHPGKCKTEGNVYKRARGGPIGG